MQRKPLDHLQIAYLRSSLEALREARFAHLNPGGGERWETCLPSRLHLLVLGDSREHFQLPLVRLVPGSPSCYLPIPCFARSKTKTPSGWSALGASAGRSGERVSHTMHPGPKPPVTWRSTSTRL